MALAVQLATLLLFCVGCNVCIASQSSPGVFRVLSLSDLHLNTRSKASCLEGHPRPVDGDATPTAWCDSTLALVRDAIRQVDCATVVALIVPGDSLRHAYDESMTEQEALHTFSVLQSEFNAQFRASCGAGGANVSQHLLSFFSSSPQLDSKSFRCPS